MTYYTINTFGKTYQGANSVKSFLNDALVTKDISFGKYVYDFCPYFLLFYLFISALTGGSKRQERGVRNGKNGGELRSTKRLAKPRSCKLWVFIFLPEIMYFFLVCFYS